jgi:hypothetical protein
VEKKKNFFLCPHKMEVITDNMYKSVVYRHNAKLKSTQMLINNRTQILLLDFDVYTKSNFDLRQSLFYIYIDSLPSYCMNRISEFEVPPICIKHLDLCVLTSV